MKRWKKFKYDCECSNNKHIVEQVKSQCKLEQNKLLPYLNRFEGGMGGDNNLIHKQIRFRDYYIWSQIPWCVDNDIVFDRIEDKEEDKWTYEELEDIIDAFIETANYNLKSECVRGHIER